MWKKSQLEDLSLFGIDVHILSTSEINEEVIKKLYLLSSVAEYNEKENFKKEIKRILRTTMNNKYGMFIIFIRSLKMIFEINEKKGTSLQFSSWIQSFSCASR